MADIRSPRIDSKMKAVRGSYVFGPTLLYSEASYRDITNYIHQATTEEAGRSYTIIPTPTDGHQSTDERPIEVVLKEMLEDRGGGFVYLSPSLPRDAGINLSSSPGVLFDAVVIPQTDVPYVLTFSTDPDSKSTRACNIKLASLLLRKLRIYVDEDFTFAFGVVGEKERATEQGFLDCVETLRKRSTRFALRRYLTMTADKYAALTRGLVAMLLFRDQMEFEVSRDCKQSAPRSIYLDAAHTTLGKLIGDTR